MRVKTLSTIKHAGCTHWSLIRPRIGYLTFIGLFCIMKKSESHRKVNIMAKKIVKMSDSYYKDMAQNVIDQSMDGTLTKMSDQFKMKTLIELSSHILYDNKK